MLDYQALLYGPVYEQFGQAATLSTVNGATVSITVCNKTIPSAFVGHAVEYQTFRPTALVLMSELLAANITPAEDLIDGELTMDGKTWSIKSFEYVPSPVGIDDGELRFILKDDLNV